MPDHDIGSGVEVTALAVAAARALESERPDRLLDDPLAAALVAAGPVRLPVRAADLAPDDAGFWQQMAVVMGLRSRLFDDHLLAAAHAGVRQVVILGAGLDVRTHRLAWPPGTVVYPIDLPGVLAFVQSVLRARGARSRCVTHPVPADLREDWTTPLRAAGFRPDRPTAWLAEGLLAYLPPATEAALFAAVDALSAPGSRVAVELSDPRLLDAVRDDAVMSRSRERFGVDMAELWDFSPRPPADQVLHERGWEVEVHTVAAVAARFGRSIGGSATDAVGAARIVLGARTRGPSGS